MGQGGDAVPLMITTSPLPAYRPAGLPSSTRRIATHPVGWGPGSTLGLINGANVMAGQAAERLNTPGRDAVPSSANS
jgi:branched-subunit amino acid aminotransferase/4-amino-4-deoxychorismate lyase